MPTENDYPYTSGQDGETATCVSGNSKVAFTVVKNTINTSGIIIIITVDFWCWYYCYYGYGYCSFWIFSKTNQLFI